MREAQDMKCDAMLFTQMYEKIYHDLYRFALCMMKNGHNAEDAVSDAVVAAYENIHKLRSQDAFKSWMFTILANICRKRLKTQAGEQSRQVVEGSYFQEPSEEPDYGKAMDVRKAFFILSEEEQVIVGLSVFGGYNSKEIGHMLKMNDSTVRSKRKRALEKMECVLK